MSGTFVSGVGGGCRCLHFLCPQMFISYKYVWPLMDRQGVNSVQCLWLVTFMRCGAKSCFGAHDDAIGSFKGACACLAAAVVWAYATP